ncbi:MAG TPA: serine protease [Ignavibacteriaceae bacterium]|jgi:hypothetical protein|nr:MAG: putative serine protease HtrA [Ignavibacteria bacterium ADurb.Bin266]OQY70914.1 MAG: hypothetical protein B6D44_14480 [Ignavibacteriales bacterium UTCHB2]HQF42559.1 serine protease [Ignavibacteriaceae bacterium]HQI40628.1 serine protease [Ignavibacteriaceae bacterium]
MKKFYLTLLFIAIFFYFSKVYAQSISDIVEEVEESVVMVLTYDATGSQIGQGSGVFVTKEGKILTNAHVIEDAYSAEVISSIGNFNQVEILFKDEDKDLALIKVNTNNSLPPLFAEDTNFKAGQRVIAIGNPLGLEKTVSDGLISGIRRLQNGVELIQTSVPISPGSSGGILLDEYGFIIGITTSTIIGGQNINFAISLNTILLFVDDYQNAISKGTIKVEKLKVAKVSVWYRVVLHWIGNIFLLLLSLVFGNTFYYGLPLLFLAGYLIYGIVRGLWWLVSFPVKKYKERKSYLQYQNSVSSISDHTTSTDYDSLIDDEEVEDEGIDDEELEENNIDFYCTKCGTLNQVDYSMQGDIITCINCKKSITVPYD